MVCPVFGWVPAFAGTTAPLIRFAHKRSCVAGDLDSNQDWRSQSALRTIDVQRFFLKPHLKCSSKHQ